MASKKKASGTDQIVRCFEVGNPRLHEKGHTIYKVTLKSIKVDKPDEDVQEVVVWRRYNDFKKLYKAMFHLHRALQRREDFPPFARSKVFGRFSDDVIKERQESAQDLLNFVGQKMYLVNSKPFKQFFQGGEEVLVNPYSDPILEPVKLYEDEEGQESERNEGEQSLRAPQQAAQEASMTRVESSASLGGVWKYRQAADDISIDDLGDDDTDFTDESSLGTPLPDTEMSFFDPLHPVGAVTAADTRASGLEDDTWLLSALSACADLTAESQVSSTTSQDSSMPAGEAAQSAHPKEPILNEGQDISAGAADLSAIIEPREGAAALPDDLSSNFSESSSAWDEFDPLGKPKTPKVEIGKGDLPFSLVNTQQSEQSAGKPEIGKGDLTFDLMGSSVNRAPPDGQDSSVADVSSETASASQFHPAANNSALPASKGSSLHFWSSTPKGSPQHKSAVSSGKSSPARSPRKQLMEMDLGERGNYIIQAAKQISLAQQCEANGNYHMAFTYFKSGIGTLISGVQGDDNKARREVVRRKTARYLLKAEDIYNSYLSGDKTASVERWHTGDVSPIGELDPHVATLQGSTTELLQFTVLGIIDKVMLVLHKTTNETYIMKVLHKNSVSSDGRSVVPVNCGFMVNLLRFYETDSSIYLLLQHATGGKLWNYISGYLQQHTDTQQIDHVFDDTHERYLRTHKPSVSDSKETKSQNEPGDEAANIKSGKVTFSHQSSKTSTSAQRQESTTEVDSLLDDNQSYDSDRKGLSDGEHILHEEDETSEALRQATDTPGDQTFSDVLKAADISMKAFSINSFESDAGVSRVHSTTSDPGVEAIPEAGCEVSPSEKLAEGDVFNTRKSESTNQENTHTQAEGKDGRTNLDSNSTLNDVKSALQKLDEGKPTAVVDSFDANLVLPNVPTDNPAASSGEEVSIYDLHKPADATESESSSPERPSVLSIDKTKSEGTTTTSSATPTASGKTSSSLSSPRDPDRDPVIYRLPSQERSLESEVRPRKRNLSCVFRDLDLAEGDAVSRVHLPEACVCQWAAEMVSAIDHLHSVGVVCRDLHPQNILLGERGHILLTYFSQWRCVDEHVSPHALDNFYTAPEVGSIHSVTPVADWWSLGVILFELLTGKSLESCYPGGFTPHSSVVIPEHVSHEARNLLEQLLKYNAGERLGAGTNGVEDIKHHSFFANIDWKTLAQRC